MNVILRFWYAFFEALSQIKTIFFAFLSGSMSAVQAIRLLRDVRASWGGGGLVGTLVGLLVSLLIGIIVIVAIIGSANQSGWSAAANTTWTNLTANIWVAIGLLVIVPIIVGAAAILFYVRRGM